MSVQEVMIPVKCCSKFGPNQMPEELADRLTSEEYQMMRDIMHGYRKKGFGAAAGITVFLVITFLIGNAAFSGIYPASFGFVGLIGIPWGVCPSVASFRAKAKINAEILNPKGLNLQCERCLAHKIVLGPINCDAQPADAAALEAQSMTNETVIEEKSETDVLFGKRERERSPANYGVVELTHSAKSDAADDVVRSMYTHISDGAKRSERIIACNMKVVYVPEEDLLELAQIYMSKQMGELRKMMKNNDGSRRVLRFFHNDGTSVTAVTSCSMGGSKG